ncbi:hypothetical protein [Arthrobacter sp. ERGS1:01]|uniref:hypothetical protein n=1 Tax=Arthrobacter sp. ERGS1:01 TaxID=1704044 RepID=UPI000A66B6D0|nr:hypothetical protein [Arthrobacter sp. ERGS1:01]
MGKQSRRRSTKPERRLRVRSIRQDPPDLERLTTALLDMALRQAAQEKQAQEERREADRKARQEAPHE